MGPDSTSNRRTSRSEGYSPQRGTFGCGSELYRLRLEELLQSERAELTAVPGLLVAAERRQRVEGRPVHLHLAGPQPPRNALGALVIPGPDPARQPVHGVV